MGKEYLLDTNIVTKTLQGLLPENGLEFMSTVLETTPNISVVARIELLGWLPQDPDFAADLELFVATSHELA